jgi:GWxTD domain-containing protein
MGVATEVTKENQRNVMMISKRYTGILFYMALLIAILPAGCRSVRHAGHSISSYPYHITDHTPLPSYALYQFSADSMRIWFDIPFRSSQNQPAESTESQGEGYRLRVDLFERVGSKVIKDSSTWHFSADTSVSSGIISGFADVFTGEPEGRHLRLVLTHLEHSSSFTFERVLPASWPPSSTHFLVFDTSGIVLHPENISTNTPLIIESSIVTDQKVKVRYYRHKHPPAFPPFATLTTSQLSYGADSLFDITFSEGVSRQLTFTAPGIYHLTTDSTSRSGFTLWVRDYPYPWIEQPAQMIPPLRYITSEREFNALTAAPNPQQAAEEFWLRQAGNPMRASRLIREYYQRVEKANYLFSSYLDGWKSDRGMIYIVYGPPSTITRTETSEIWTYGESPHLLSLSFVFIRMQNPFTGNDYMLERSPTFKTGWHQRVSSWRR